MTNKTPKIDEKQKKQMLDKIAQDFPEVMIDSLKRYYAEKMVEAYLTDSDGFNRAATEAMKAEKKKGLPEPKPLPEEIIAITKGNDEPKKDENLTINSQGMITAA